MRKILVPKPKIICDKRRERRDSGPSITAGEPPTELGLLNTMQSLLRVCKMHAKFVLIFAQVCPAWFIITMHLTIRGRLNPGSSSNEF